MIPKMFPNKDKSYIITLIDVKGDRIDWWDDAKSCCEVGMAVRIVTDDNREIMLRLGAGHTLIMEEKIDENK